MTANHHTLWEKCLQVIRDNVNENAFNTWFTPIKPLLFKDHALTIQVPSQFFYEYLEDKYVDLLSYTLSRVIGPQTTLNYKVVVDNTSKTTTTLQSDRVPDREPAKGMNLAPNGMSSRPIQSWNPNTNPRYNFNNYFEGKSNKLACVVGNSVAENPGNTSFNPCFIYGHSGVGKTHLCHAIANRIMELFPEKKVLYISAHLFKVQFTNATRQNTANDFIHFYQNVDVLILDDIQELAGLNATQNTYFHIFNHLHQLGKQIILTADRLPVDLDGIEERLLSRLKWGVTAQMHSPDIELRKKILHHKIKHDGLIISDEIVDYIAENITEHVRDLEGIITSLLACSLAYNRDVDMELTKRVVSQTVKLEKRKITIDKIQDVVSKFYNVEISLIQSKSRKREIVQARQVSMFLSKKFTDSSYSHIGIKIGKRDHATVLHACKTVQDSMDVDKSFSKSIAEIEKILQN